jgi:thiamine-phosphate pyrophosphorylase
MKTGEEFLLAVITRPEGFAGEQDWLEGMLSSGLRKLHLRRPGGTVEGLLERLAPRWASRLVVHGPVSLARKYGVLQVHGSVELLGTGLRVSTSVHSRKELERLPEGLEYALISPVFDSISKPGYRGNDGLLGMPQGYRGKDGLMGTSQRLLPCRPVGLGGVSTDTIGLMLERGWTGAAVLGWIWEEPRKAVSRFEQLKKMIDG